MKPSSLTGSTWAMQFIANSTDMQVEGCYPYIYLYYSGSHSRPPGRLADCPTHEPPLLLCAEPARPKTRSAAKNAKRKEKRLAEQGPAGTGGSGSSGGGGAAAAAADSAAAAVQAMSLGGGSDGRAAQAPAAAAAPAAAGAAGVEEAPSVEKQIRNLKKKMRQAEALVEKRAGGAALSAEEEAKLGKLAVWQEELRQLEAQL